MDLLCDCPGTDRHHPVECEQQADAEDGLCSNCRERDCPNTPLAWYLDQVHEVFESNVMEVPDEIHVEYLRRCKEAGVQP